MSTKYLIMYINGELTEEQYNELMKPYHKARAKQWRTELVIGLLRSITAVIGLSLCIIIGLML